MGPLSAVSRHLGLTAVPTNQLWLLLWPLQCLHGQDNELAMSIGPRLPRTVRACTTTTPCTAPNILGHPNTVMSNNTPGSGTADVRHQSTEQRPPLSARQNRDSQMIHTCRLSSSYPSCPCYLYSAIFAEGDMGQNRSTDWRRSTRFTLQASTYSILRCAIYPQTHVQEGPQTHARKPVIGIGESQFFRFR
jgi:hypothetical protein